MPTSDSSLPENASLAEQAGYWQKHQRYPKFAAIGIFNPGDYGKTQDILNEGPERWREEAGFLRRLNIEPENGVPLELPEALQNSIVEPWREEFGASLARGDEASFLLGFANWTMYPFFCEIADGFDAAIVSLALDDRDIKPSRRREWNRKLLFFLQPDPAERVAVLRRATDAGQPPVLRRRALRWLAPSIPPLEELRALLESFASEPDPLVKFWAAYRLCTGVGFSSNLPRPSWVEQALYYGLTERVLLDTYEDHDKDGPARTVEILRSFGRDALRRATTYLEEKKSHNAYAWWHLLAVIYSGDSDADAAVADQSRGEIEVRALRDRWLAHLPASSLEALEHYLRQFHAASEAYMLLNPEIQPDAPPLSDSDGDERPERFWAFSDAFELKHGLDDPRCYLKLHARLAVELQFQERASGTDKSRLEKVRQLLDPPAPLQSEIKAIRDLVEPAIPYAIADYLLREGASIEASGLFGRWKDDF